MGNTTTSARGASSPSVVNRSMMINQQQQNPSTTTSTSGKREQFKQVSMKKKKNMIRASTTSQQPHHFSVSSLPAETALSQLQYSSSPSISVRKKKIKTPQSPERKNHRGKSPSHHKKSEESQLSKTTTTMATQTARSKGSKGTNAESAMDFQTKPTQPANDNPCNCDDETSLSLDESEIIEDVEQDMEERSSMFRRFSSILGDDEMLFDMYCGSSNPHSMMNTQDENLLDNDYEFNDDPPSPHAPTGLTPPSCCVSCSICGSANHTTATPQGHHMSNASTPHHHCCGYKTPSATTSTSVVSAGSHSSLSLHQHSASSSSLSTLVGQRARAVGSHVHCNSASMNSLYSSSHLTSGMHAAMSSPALTKQSPSYNDQSIAILKDLINVNTGL
ncbi:hypothetical protein C9374_001411 [Naegleria lovaniensis]|uniref:Uncharacterized protein n=1 Tax=Naegleria lovaniensis TaxID=51637 RepID=A0AA88GS13_NAELO|nr:uncharacterized protein C9374_001411 [Naegleria lovaniensis]KAG2387817.1 hypothetical protein C9374_001411 [Naegleria lovaniensis]